MVAWTTVPSYIKDKHRTLDYRNKGIRGQQGRASIYTRAPQVFDHFMEAGVSTALFPLTATRTGTGAGGATFTGSTSIAGGAFVGINGTATDELELAGTQIIWKPSSAASAPLAVEARFKAVGTTTATDGTFWFGFADATNYAGVLSTLSTAGVLTSTGPTSAAMIGYSSLVTVTGSPGFGTLVAASYLAATGTLVDLAVTKDSNSHIFRVEIDANGAVSFIVDDSVKKRTGTGTVATGTALTPYFYFKSENGHALTSTLDFLGVFSELV